MLNAESNVLQQRRAADMMSRRLDLQMSLMKTLGGGYREEAGEAAESGATPAPASRSTAKNEAAARG